MIETAQELICNLYNHCKVTTCHSFRVGNDLCGFGRYLGVGKSEIKSLSDIHYDKDLALSYTNFLETKAYQLLLCLCI